MTSKKAWEAVLAGLMGRRIFPDQQVPRERLPEADSAYALTYVTDTPELSTDAPGWTASFPSEGAARLAAVPEPRPSEHQPPHPGTDQGNERS